MKSKIEIEKINQRLIYKKKRLIINQSIDNKNLFFNKKIEGSSWFKKGKIIASFLSINSEISTLNLNQFIIDNGKTLCLPVINIQKNRALIFRKYKIGEKLIAGKFGVMIPFRESNCLPDIVFTPCLAYDFEGFRLGYGGGYYDKTFSYFKSINHKFIAIGLAYDAQRVDKVIHNNLDQKLNYILTEKKLYKII